MRSPDRQQGRPLKELSLVGSYRVIRILDSAPKTDREKGDPKLPDTAFISVDRGLLGINDTAKLRVLAVPGSRIEKRKDKPVSEIVGNEFAYGPAAYYELPESRKGIKGIGDRILGRRVYQLTASGSAGESPENKAITITAPTRLRRFRWNEFGYRYSMKVK